MTTSLPAYTVGRGNPPLHTRFKKGQSGNPSGKPGAAKLAKHRFQRALYAALEASEGEVEASKPDNVLGGIARRMALDAAAGRAPAVRMVLSLLDAESAKESAEANSAKARAGEEEASLLQGKKQGSEIEWLEEMLRLLDAESEIAARTDGNSHRPRRDEQAPDAPEPEHNEAEPFSLLQGKTQGSGRKAAGQICTPRQSGGTAAAAHAESEKRAQLMTSAAHDVFSQRACAGGT